MRITFGTKYNQMNHYQNTLQNKLNDKNTQIASGLKIQYGYQDASVYNQNLRFENEINTLAQGIDVAEHAQTATLNTDKTLSDLSETMVQFKTKLIQAANDIHSPASREAIANDMEALKKHFLSLANTSIGGNFIFGGSRVDHPPFDEDGNYHGNDEKLNVLVSSHNLVPYNVTGQELFFGRDSDKQRIITTNLKMLNQSKLHPGIMDSSNRSNLSQEVYIKASDTLRDLIGDDDSDPSNDVPEYFYLRGVRSDGSVFKSKFALDKGFSNDARATKVQDLLDRIGKEFGNTALNKVVEVTLNQWGQIEIKDLEPGKSGIDFHMISSDMNVDNIDDLITNGARVTAYNQSAFLTDRVVSTIVGVTDKSDFRKVELPTAFITRDNKAAEMTTKLEDLFPPNVSTLLISGTRPNTPDGKINTGEDQEPLDFLRFDIKGATARDLAQAIKEHFGGNIDVSITKGRLIVIDNNVANQAHDFQDPPFNGEHGFSIALTTLDEFGAQTDGVPTDYGNEYDRTFFQVEGSKLTSSLSQVLANGSGYANGETKLSDVVGASIEGQSYVLKVNDMNGVQIEARIVFDEAGAYMLLPNVAEDGQDYTIPLFNPIDEPPGVSVTKPDDVTYRQLMDALSIALNYSNQDHNSYKAVEPPKGGVVQATKDAYVQLLTDAKGMFDVAMTPDGRIQIQDKMRSVTRMNVMFYDASSNDFSHDTLQRNTNSLRLNANNALVIDTPEINFFKEIDEIIEAVRKGVYRAGAKDSYGAIMRNKGVQNGITAFDHLSDHIEKIIALNGSHGKTFENVIRRHEILKTQIEGLKGQNIGTDIADTYNKFSNITTNLNAVMNSTSRINQMSLVNYL